MNERRCYICNVFPHWPRFCLAIDRKRAQTALSLRAAREKLPDHAEIGQVSHISVGCHLTIGHHCFKPATKLTTNHYLNQWSPSSLMDLLITRPQWLNSLWPNDPTLLHRSASTLIQVMAWCRQATSHYLNQRWLTIKDVLWHSPQTNFTGRYQFLRWV